jgi:hypothetical protein
MHIRGGHMNPNPSLGGAQASAQAACLAEQTRKKLFAASTELDAPSTSESAWMVTAWAGGGSAPNQQDQQPSGHESSPESSQSTNQESSQASRYEPGIRATGPVSFWA